MTRTTLVATAALLIGGCGIFGGDDEVKEHCFEEQEYQLERLNDRIVVPEDLDDLEEFKEMPIPTAETPPRPEGAHCITEPPSVRTE